MAGPRHEIKYGKLYNNKKESCLIAWILEHPLDGNSGARVPIERFIDHTEAALTRAAHALVGHTIGLDNEFFLISVAARC